MNKCNTCNGLGLYYLPGQIESCKKCIMDEDIKCGNINCHNGHYVTYPQDKIKCANCKGRGGYIILPTKPPRINDRIYCFCLW